VLRGKAATLAAERIPVTDEAGNKIDIKAEIEALNADVDSMLAAEAAGEAAGADIEVDDLEIDVAGSLAADDEDEDDEDEDDDLEDDDDEDED